MIIANHNYREFVGAAIISALAVDWPDKEVIVVDDASTDDSKSVIEDFNGRVAAYFRPKSHQLGAHRFGFDQSSGEVIILLDADDVLEPDVMREVAKVWQQSVSKVQYRMNLIDASGTQLGTAIPQFPTANRPEQLRRAYLRTMAYTTPPGSGNAYSRNFVQDAYAMAPATMRWSDDILLTLAPILGDVVTIQKPLARYRVHGKNDGALGSIDATKFRNRLNQDIEKARLFTNTCRQRRLPISPDPLRRSLHHLQYRFGSYLVEPAAHPFPDDTVSALVLRLLVSIATSPQMRVRDKILLLGWVVASASAPSNYRQRLVLWRFAVKSRPALLRTLLSAFSSLRSARLPDGADPRHIT